jgi:hypothetical protein
MSSVRGTVGPGAAAGFVTFGLESTIADRVQPLVSAWPSRT